MRKTTWNFNSIDYPYQIIEALENHELVVFAGAGVSKSPPTLFPDFKQLVADISYGTGCQWDQEEETPDAFLGRLKSEKGIDVNGKAAGLLSGEGVLPNQTHKTIIDLFDSPDSIRIVTTNYDPMFEKSLDEADINVPVFSAPALPLGDDFYGLIHIHGDVATPSYMVVTDEDFGKAYITERYTARFLTRLFETYTVLFVGYSYDDVIVQYLTRALYSHSSKGLFVLSDKPEGWKRLGIQVISYPKGKHDLMRDSLSMIGRIVKKGLLDWKKQFSEMADAPPEDPELVAQLEYALKDIETVNILANHIHGTRWLEWLDRRGAFDECFTKSGELSRTSIAWADWLCKNILGSEDEAFKDLLLRHQQIINEVLANQVLKKLAYDGGQLSDKYFKEYLLLLDEFVRDPFLIHSLIIAVGQRSMEGMAFRLFKKYFIYHLKLDKWFGIDATHVLYSHSFSVSHDFLRFSWEGVKTYLKKENNCDILQFLKGIIEDVYDLYVEVEETHNDGTLYGMTFFSVEERDSVYNRDVLYTISQIIVELCREEWPGYKQYLRGYLQECLASRVLLRNTALRAIRESCVFTNDEKLQLIIENGFVGSQVSKEQVFLLAKSVFLAVSPQGQDRLLDEIEALCDNLADRTKAYETYNWCVWLHEIDETNARINEIIKSILEVYHFMPRKHPELNIEFSFGSLEIQSPVNSDQLISLELNTLHKALLHYSDKSSFDTSAEGFFHEFSHCIQSYPEWCLKVIRSLFQADITEYKIWSFLFRGLSEADFSISVYLEIMVLLSENIDMVSDMRGAADLLWTVVEKKATGEELKLYEEQLFQYSEKLWDHRPAASTSLTRKIDIVYNSISGLVLVSWINLLYYVSEKDIPQRYKECFEKALCSETLEHEVAVCVLAGHYNILYSRDREWYLGHFEKILKGESCQDFRDAWEGMAWFSRIVYTASADMRAELSIEAVKHLYWLDNEVRSDFIEMYIVLLVYVIDDPLQQYIPAFYDASPEAEGVALEVETTHKVFIESIRLRLHKMSSDEIEKWWKNWLKKFLENRKENKPQKLSDIENQALIRLLPELGPVFEEAALILQTGDLPSDVDLTVWYWLDEGEFAEKYPSSMADFMTKLLNAQKELTFSKDNVISIARKLRGLSEAQREGVQEALLRHNIDINIE